MTNHWLSTVHNMSLAVHVWRAKTDVKALPALVNQTISATSYSGCNDNEQQNCTTVMYLYKAPQTGTTARLIFSDLMLAFASARTTFLCSRSKQCKETFHNHGSALIEEIRDCLILTIENSTRLLHNATRNACAIEPHGHKRAKLLLLSKS